jgi:hypothetical protein
MQRSSLLKSKSSNQQETGDKQSGLLAMIIVTAMRTSNLTLRKVLTNIPRSFFIDFTHLLKLLRYLWS